MVKVFSLSNRYFWTWSDPKLLLLLNLSDSLNKRRVCLAGVAMINDAFWLVEQDVVRDDDINRLQIVFFFQMLHKGKSTYWMFQSRKISFHYLDKHFYIFLTDNRFLYFVILLKGKVSLTVGVMTSYTSVAIFGKVP